MPHAARHILLLFTIGAFFLGTSPPCQATAGGTTGVTILDVVWEELPEQYLVHLKTSGKPNYSLHELFRPLRVAVDFADVSLGQMKLPLDIPRGPITHIESKPLEDQAATRGQSIILHLSEEMVYSVDPAGNGLVLRFPRKADPPRDPTDGKTEKKKPEGERALISAASLAGGQGKAAGKNSKETASTKEPKQPKGKPEGDITQAAVAGKQPSPEKKGVGEKEAHGEGGQNEDAPGDKIIPGILDENPVVEKTEQAREAVSSHEKPAADREKGKEKEKENKAGVKPPAPRPTKEEQPPPQGPAEKSVEKAPPPAASPPAQPLPGPPAVKKAEEAHKDGKVGEAYPPAEKTENQVPAAPKKPTEGRKKSATKKSGKAKARTAAPASAEPPNPPSKAAPPSSLPAPPDSKTSSGPLVGVEIPPRRGEEGVRVQLRGGETIQGATTGPGPAGEGESMVMTPGTVFRPRK